jgi:hypothetical protein
MSKASRMMRELLSNPDRYYHGAFLNDLLEQFQKGYPVQRLLSLLSSSDDRLLGSAAFIASELGGVPGPVLTEIARLLDHPATLIRGEAIDCVLVSATRDHGAEIAKVVSMLGDHEPGVRWSVMQFLARAAHEQLHAGMILLENSRPKSPHLQGLRWLLSEKASIPEEVIALLRGQDSTLRKFAAAAAARIAEVNPTPLFVANSVQDTEVKDFASSWLEVSGNLPSAN